MSPAHHSRNQGRGLVLLFVVAVIAALAVVTRSPGTAAPGGPPVTSASFVLSPGAESSAWYCTGASTPALNLAVGSLILTNTTAHHLSGTITSTSETGAQVQTSVVVPAHGQLVPTIAAPSSGNWVAQSVVMTGGGVAVDEAVHGSAGWSVAPCVSRTSQAWYFPSGTTSGTDQLYMSVFNPTSSPDVVDMDFITPGGENHPIVFQGLVIQPGQVAVANVSAYVQEQSAVAATVTARTGRVVASELEVFAGGSDGLAVVPGVATPQADWTIPQSNEGLGTSTQIDIFNPGPDSARVTVSTRLLSGPLAPLTQVVAPLTTWVLSTSDQTRIPKGDPYAVEVHASGGSGVAVGRLVSAPSTTTAPQAGLANAIDGLTSNWPSYTWLVPSPGSTATPAVSGVLPEHLALSNPTDSPVTAVVSVMTPSHTRQVKRVRLAPHTGTSLGGSVLFGAGLYPLLVHAGGPLSVSEDVGPSGAFGVVTQPGLAVDTAS